MSGWETVRLDAEVAFVDRSRFVYPWMAESAAHMHRDFTPPDLWRILGRNKYAGGIAVAMLSDSAETDWLLELAAGEAPWIAGVIANTLEPRWLVRDRFAGVHLRPSTEAARLVGAAAEAGKCIDLRATAAEAPMALELARTAREARIAIVPEGAPHWDATPWREFAGLEGVMVKIRGLINQAGAAGWKAASYQPFVHSMLKWFGPERVMYGSDWPHCMHTGTWKESLAAFTQALGAQTIDVRSLILGDNAARHYGSSTNAMIPA
jgi:L-fuconolactonase